jgi:hypothetical protein
MFSEKVLNGNRFAKRGMVRLENENSANGLGNLYSIWGSGIGVLSVKIKLKISFMQEERVLHRERNWIKLQEKNKTWQIFKPPS